MWKIVRVNNSKGVPCPGRVMATGDCMQINTYSRFSLPFADSYSQSGWCLFRLPASSFRSIFGCNVSPFSGLNQGNGISQCHHISVVGKVTEVHSAAQILLSNRMG